MTGFKLYGEKIELLQDYHNNAHVPGFFKNLGGHQKISVSRTQLTKEALGLLGENASVLAIGDRKWCWDNREAHMVSNIYNRGFKAMNHANSFGYYCKFNKQILPYLKRALKINECKAKTIWARDSLQGIKAWEGLFAAMKPDSGMGIERALITGWLPLTENKTTTDVIGEGSITVTPTSYPDWPILETGLNG